MSFEHTETDLPVEKEYPKLVRDRIPEIIIANEGIVVPTRTLTNDKEYLAYLLRKVREEAEELSEATTDSNIIEEVADVYEIIDTVLALKGIERSIVLASQKDKREKRGGFSERILMLGK
jgi:predicted house-cleaning noncanonical NTP pyrophosphatase (MazG superfamily)